MSRGQLRTAVRHLFRLAAGRAESAGLTDTQLLERFLAWRDDAAFEVLVWRHGPMVYGVSI